MTDIVMTLLILTTRYRGDLDSMLIEDVTLLSYNFGLIWISMLDEYEFFVNKMKS